MNLPVLSPTVLKLNVPIIVRVHFKRTKKIVFALEIVRLYFVKKPVKFTKLQLN